ncbi:IS256 family transposase [Streptomyces sp. NPDC004069]
MTAPDSLPLHALAEDNLAAASPDLLRAMIKTFADALMSAEADALCNAEYRQVSDERVNHRNGYRPREWDTRAGTVELAVPKLRSGSCFPHWLLERRRRAEQALISVVATAYLLGVSTRRVEKLAESLGVTQLSKSQVSAMAKHLDEQVVAFRNRPLDAGPYTFVWVDALTQKVREGGRINVHALIAVGVNADGHREILGLDVATAEDGAGWLAFLRSLIARGLSGVQLVVSDAHAGLVDAIGAVLPGASWQRCRTHYARNRHHPAHRTHRTASKTRSPSGRRYTTPADVTRPVRGRGSPAPLPSPRLVPLPGPHAHHRPAPRHRRPRVHVIAGILGHRQRFSGQRRLVRLTLADPSVQELLGGRSRDPSAGGDDLLVLLLQDGVARRAGCRPCGGTGGRSRRGCRRRR